MISSALLFSKHYIPFQSRNLQTNTIPIHQTYTHASHDHEMVFPGQMRFLFAFLALVIPGCLAGSIWPGDWHFSVELHRWSDGLCGDEVSERELLEAGGCVGKHAFTSFSYRVHKHFNSEYVKQMRMM